MALLAVSCLPTPPGESGDITITATVNGGQVAGPVTVPLNGVSVTVDEAALTLDAINFTSGSSGSVAISPSYLGFTSINIDFAAITATGGSLTLVDAGPPAEYGYSIGPVMVSGQFDAVNTIPLSDSWSVTQQVQYLLDDSNLRNYSYDNLTVAMSARWRF